MRFILTSYFYSKLMRFQSYLSTHTHAYAVSVRFRYLFFSNLGPRSRHLLTQLADLGYVGTDFSLSPHYRILSLTPVTSLSHSLTVWRIGEVESVFRSG
jgi:hypothetical protein